METIIKERNVRQKIYSYLSREEKEAIEGLEDLALYKSLMGDYRGENTITITLDDADEFEDEISGTVYYYGYVEIVVKHHGARSSFIIGDLKDARIGDWRRFATSVLQGEDDELDFPITQINGWEFYMRSREENLSIWMADQKNSSEIALDRKVYAKQFYEEMMKLIDNPDFQRILKKNDS